MTESQNQSRSKVTQSSTKLYTPPQKEVSDEYLDRFLQELRKTINEEIPR